MQYGNKSANGACEDNNWGPKLKREEMAIWTEQIDKDTFATVHYKTFWCPNR